MVNFGVLGFLLKKGVEFQVHFNVKKRMHSSRDN